MSRALQCPVCGFKHPVDELPDAATFECEGCGRILKVPKKTRTASSSGRASGAAAGGAGATILPNRGRGSADRPYEPDADGAGDEPDDTGGADGPVRSPVWLRILAWLIGLPLSAVVVFGVANATGLLTGSQLTDMFLDARLSAYGRLAALLPLWALLAALIVQGIDVLWKGWVRRRHRAADSAPVDEPESVDA